MHTKAPLSHPSARATRKLATVLACLLMTGTALTSATSFAQDTAPKTRTSFDGRQIPANQAAAFVSNQVIVHTVPGTNVVDLINSYINDTPAAPKPTVTKITEDGTLFALTYATGSAEDANALSALQNVISDADPTAADLDSTKLITALSNAPQVLSATHNFLAYGAQSSDINNIINEGDGAGIDANNPKPPASTAEPVFPNDANYNVQWHLKQHDAAHGATTSPGGSNFPTMWGTTQGSEDVVIAVVDSGIVAAHPDIDFSRSILPGYDFVSAAIESANDGAPGYDADPTEPQLSAVANGCPNNVDAGWHGTHVAGIAGAASANNGSGIAGGAWNVKILPVRVLSKCNSGTRLDIAVGIYWAAGIPLNGIPTNPNPADIINLSLGGLAPNGCDPMYRAAIDAATAKGITVVVAAGNSGSDASTSSPANCKNVINVAASDARGHMTDYSNFGDLIDIVAPGGATNRDDNGDGQPDGILSTVDADFSYYQGTSMASPLVAAAAALLKSQKPELTPAEIRKLLKDNAIPRSDIHCPKSCGAGLLNAAIIP